MISEGLTNYSLIDKLLYLFNNSLKCIWIIHSEICQNLTAYLYASLVQTSHQLRIRHPLEASGSIDTLNPQCTKVTFLIATVAEGISQALLPSILGNGPNIFTGAIITTR